MEISTEAFEKKPKRLTSVVWNHFERVRTPEAQYAICVHCNKKLSGSSNSGTTHLRNHLLRCLKRSSNYDVTQILSAKRKRNTTTITTQTATPLSLTPIIYDHHPPPKIKHDNILITPFPPPLNKFDHNQNNKDDIINQQTLSLSSVKFDQHRTRLDLAKMIMLHGYPLAMPHHVGFKLFVKNLQPLFEIDNNNDAIEIDCMNIYIKEKQRVHDAIHHLQHGTRINLAVGMWAGSPSDSSEYICLTASYIDAGWKLQKKMLNFISLDVSHTDDVLSEVIVKCLTEWGVDHNLFSMTFDDCSAYELMVFKVRDCLSQNNRPLLKKGELFDVRCITHLLKSIVQEATEAFRDVIHMVRESIRYVKSTQVILGKFNEFAQQAGIGINNGKRLVLDCPMRWNSTYMMLESAIEYKDAFLKLLQENSDSITLLSNQEWERVSSIASYLGSLIEFINAFAGNKYTTANIFFPEICDLHIQLIEWCKGPDEFLSSAAIKMKNKFDVYWSKCSLALAIVAILDPRFKIKVVEYYYRQIYNSDAPDHIKQVTDGLRELFNEYSMSPASVDQDSALLLQGNSLTSTSNDSTSRDKLKGFDKFLYETSQSQNMSSDLDKYLEEPVFPRNNDFSILNWWKVHTPRYPVLSMMARDMLAIPVSTVEAEVAFSNCGRVLDPYRTSLSPDTREALMCGQDWLRIEPEGGATNYSQSNNIALPVSMETS